MVMGGKKFGLLKREMGQEEGIINLGPLLPKRNLF